MNLTGRNEGHENIKQPQSNNTIKLNQLPNLIKPIKKFV